MSFKAGADGAGNFSVFMHLTDPVTSAKSKADLKTDVSIYYTNLVPLQIKCDDGGVV